MPSATTPKGIYYGYLTGKGDLHPGGEMQVGGAKFGCNGEILLRGRITTPPSLTDVPPPLNGDEDGNPVFGSTFEIRNAQGQRLDISKGSLTVGVMRFYLSFQYLTDIPAPAQPGDLISIDLIPDEEWPKLGIFAPIKSRIWTVWPYQWSIP